MTTSVAVTKVPRSQATAGISVTTAQVMATAQNMCGRSALPAFPNSFSFNNPKVRISAECGWRMEKDYMQRMEKKRGSRKTIL